MAERERDAQSLAALELDRARRVSQIAVYRQSVEEAAAAAAAAQREAEAAATARDKELKALADAQAEQVGCRGSTRR